jgi:hypothetical protein
MNAASSKPSTRTSDLGKGQVSLLAWYVRLGLTDRRKPILPAQSTRAVVQRRRRSRRLSSTDRIPQKCSLLTPRSSLDGQCDYDQQHDLALAVVTNGRSAACSDRSYGPGLARDLEDLILTRTRKRVRGLSEEKMKRQLGAARKY